jgi:DNA gyrase subunit A
MTPHVPPVSPSVLVRRIILVVSISNCFLFADAFIRYHQPPISASPTSHSISSSSSSSLLSVSISRRMPSMASISSSSSRTRRRRNRSSTLHILSSTPDKDWEEIDEEDDYVVSKEPFQSEADTAEAVNEYVSAMSSSSTNQYQPIELKTEVQNSFLQYALSIILGRALPDARDGLKPVHRRILYSMYQLNLAPNLPHRKCARVVGEVLGKYHPHGDMAVYDALVRMAQDFSTSYRLVDGHGNFGSVDADPAAAMRYTECRLTTMATSTLLQDINDDTVDLVPNFDGNEQEPSVLPAKLPLLLLNGSSGIAVGMATNIPPHNLREVLTACVALVQDRVDGTTRPKTTDTELCQMVPGPDFPTGASIMGTANSERLYTTGNGGIVMRAITHVEQLVRTTSSERTLPTKTAIIVTELPYQVNKAALLEQIAALVNDKKLEGISDLRDESDRDGIRVVLELKRDSIPAVVLNNLYKKTKLQTVFSGNFVALMERNGSLTPQRFTLRESLDYFLDFRFTTIRRRSSYQLRKVESRMHIVDGLLLALRRVDEVIDLIRSLPDQAACREALMKDPEREGGLLGLSKDQAESVLKLQLGQLTRLNQGKLDEERTDLESKSSNLQRLLQVDNAVYEVMVEEFHEMDLKYGDDRKTKILNDDGEVNEIDMVTNSRSGKDGRVDEQMRTCPCVPVTPTPTTYVCVNER